MKTVDPRYLALAVAGALAACATGQTPGPGPALVPSAAGPAHKPASFLYVAQCCQQIFSNDGSITLYEPGLSSVVRTITKGVANPFVVTVDRVGRIYTVSWLDYVQGVVEYDSGRDRPSRHIKLHDAWNVATDQSNNLYVAVCISCHEYQSGKGSINVYAAGTTTLLRSITDGIEAPTWMDFDNDGNLYVLNNDAAKSAVIVYATGSSKPLRRLEQGTSEPLKIALDASNDLYVLRNGYSSSPSIVEYKAESNKIVRTITNGLSSPQAMALDASGTLYVSNTPFPSNGWVSVYPPGASTPSYEITSHMDDPQLLAVDAEGNLDVGNDYYAVALAHARHGTGSSMQGSVCAYAPKAKKPLRCIQSPGYSDPYSLAVNPR